LLIIGTSPDSHMKIALAEPKNCFPVVMLIEKPLCKPSLEGLREVEKLATQKGVQVCVSYNHTTTENTVFTE